MSLPQAVSRPQACRAPASHTRPPAPRSVPPSGPSLASVTAPGDHTHSHGPAVLGDPGLGLRGLSPQAEAASRICSGGLGSTALPACPSAPAPSCGKAPRGCSPLLDSSLDASSYKRRDPLRGPRSPRILKKKSPMPSGWSGGPPGREEPCWPGQGAACGSCFTPSLVTHSLSHCITCSLSCTLTHSLTHTPPSRAEDPACCCGSSSLSPRRGDHRHPTLGPPEARGQTASSSDGRLPSG